MFERIVVLGAGAWGTALANVVARQNRKVFLWSRSAGQAARIETMRENLAYLPGVRLADEVQAVADLTCVQTADLILAAVPAQSLRAVLASLPPLRKAVPVLVCAKGIEGRTGSLMSEVVGECLPDHPPAALSGPSFAVDVGRGRPTAVTVAAEGEDLAQALAEGLGRPSFRLYFTTDLRGVEIGGAAKNVLAIACGVAAGLDLGASAAAALIARGFAELTRFGRVSGGRPETMMGLSGLGDLVLTCSSIQSRNFALGKALGGGLSLQQASDGRLAEGVPTAAILVELARTRGVEMPICESVSAILSGALDARMALDFLLARPAKADAGLDFYATPG